MTSFYSLLLVAVSFAFGVLYGETRAPISGITVQALASRAAALEQRTEELSVRHDVFATEVREFCGRDAGRR